MINDISNKKLINQYRLLHEKNDDYGCSSIELIEEIKLIIDYLKPKTVLDYGCGKGLLLKSLTDIYPEIKFYGYDPSIPGFENLTIKKADLVINTDVLEHIPENILPNVVKKISNISNYVFFNLHHTKAQTVLPNGENAHCTIKDRQWYEELFRKYFGYVDMQDGRNDFNSVCFTFFMTNNLRNKYYNIIGRETVEMKLEKILFYIRPKKYAKIFFVNIICLFIPLKRYRKKIRNLFLK